MSIDTDPEMTRRLEAEMREQGSSEPREWRQRIETLEAENVELKRRLAEVGARVFPERQPMHPAEVEFAKKHFPEALESKP